MPQLTLTDAINLALSHHRAGRLAEAEAIYRKVLATKPDQPDALHLLGVLAHQQGRGEEALELLQRAIAANPNAAPFHANLGNVLHAHRRSSEAIEAYHRSLALDANVAETHLGLGLSLEAQRQPHEAIAAYRRAAKLNPTLRDAHANLGTLLILTGQLDEAARELTRANDLAPNADTLLNLGVALQQLGRTDDAIATFETAVKLAPEDAEAHANLAFSFWSKGDVERAISEYRRVVKLAPQLAAVRSNFLLALNYSASASPEEVFEEHVEWGKRFGGGDGDAAPIERDAFPNDRSPGRRLRIGYVSPDLRDHPVGHFIESVLRSHDRERFDVFCYSEDRAADEVTERLRRHDVTWRSVARRSDDELAADIRADGIDILIDLAGHTSGNRLLALARKPAPVQASWLGYPNTTGLPAIDYRVTDALADPPGRADELSVEKLVRLPHAAWCFAPEAETPDVNDPPCRAAGHVTFGFFDDAAKANPSVIGVWAALLKRVSGSKVMLKNDPRVVGAFARLGIGSDRLTFVASESADRFRQFHEVDIVLDTFPYNGESSTCEALWMGVPVVTRAGQIHATRMGVSLLTNVGIPELIASDAENYLRIASEFAADVNRLTELRRTLRPQMRRSPLMNAAAFTRDLGSAYRTMWKAWCGA